MSDLNNFKDRSGVYFVINMYGNIPASGYRHGILEVLKMNNTNENHEFLYVDCDLIVQKIHVTNTDCKDFRHFIRSYINGWTAWKEYIN